MKVSVVVTLYNYKQYIGECIQSFLDQDFTDSEMIIVDDCSSDNPIEVISKFDTPRIRYIRILTRIDYGSERSDYGTAKNIGIKASRAEAIVMLDADDLLTKTGISLRYEKLKQGYDLVHGPCLRLEPGQTLRDKLKRDPMWDKWLNTGDVKWIHAQGFILQRLVHEKIGLYDNSFHSNDREMICRAFVTRMKIGSVSEDVAIYRIHSKQMSRKRRSRSADYKEAERKRMYEVLQIRARGNFSGLEMLNVA